MSYIHCTRILFVYDRPGCIDYTIIMSLRPILLILFYHSLAYVLKYFSYSGLLHLLCKTWCILDVGPRVHIRSLSCSHTLMPSHARYLPDFNFTIPLSSDITIQMYIFLWFQGFFRTSTFPFQVILYLYVIFISIWPSQWTRHFNMLFFIYRSMQCWFSPQVPRWSFRMVMT